MCVCVCVHCHPLTSKLCCDIVLSVCCSCVKCIVYYDDDVDNDDGRCMKSICIVRLVHAPGACI